MPHESKEWSKATFRCRNGERVGIHVYVDFDTLNYALQESGIKIGSLLEVKKYALSGSKKYAKILLKFRVDKFPVDKARSLVSLKVKSKKLYKPRYCMVEGCYNDFPDAHHNDYSKPLDVIWLCSKHHKMYENGKKLNFKMKK